MQSWGRSRGAGGPGRPFHSSSAAAPGRPAPALRWRQRRPGPGAGVAPQNWRPLRVGVSCVCARRRRRPAGKRAAAAARCAVPCRAARLLLLLPRPDRRASGRLVLPILGEAEEDHYRRDVVLAAGMAVATGQWPPAASTAQHSAAAAGQLHSARAKLPHTKRRSAGVPAAPQRQNDSMPCRRALPHCPRRPPLPPPAPCSTAARPPAPPASRGRTPPQRARAPPPAGPYNAAPCPAPAQRSPLQGPSATVSTLQPALR